MAQNLNNFDAALKEFYLPRLQSTINVNRVLMMHLNRDAGKTDSSGRRAVVPVNIRQSQALGARADGGGLPTAQNQTYVEVRVNYKYNYGTIRLTHPTIRASRNDRGAFIRVVGSEMDGIRRDLRNDTNRQLFGWGGGVLGTVNGAVAAASVTMNLDRGHRVRTGMLIDSAVTVTGASVGDSITVSAVSGNVATITAPGSIITDGSYIFREDSHGSTALEMMGLMGIVDDATYVSTLFNVPRGTYPEWNAQVVDNSGSPRAITEDILDQAILDAQSQGEGDLGLGICDPVTWRKIGQLMAVDRRYGSSMTLAGGFKALEWAGVPIVWDRDCQVDDTNQLRQMFFLDMSVFTLFELAPWDFDDTDGNVLHRRQGEAAYDATLFYYAQLGCTDPGNNVVIRDITY